MELEMEEDLWQDGQEESDNKGQISNVAKSKFEKIEVEDSDDEMELDSKKVTVKKGKKLHKGSLMPAGAHISWKDEIEKMLK